MKIFYLIDVIIIIIDVEMRKKEITPKKTIDFF
jgi:hypothetical protein